MCMCVHPRKHVVTIGTPSGSTLCKASQSWKASFEIIYEKQDCNLLCVFLKNIYFFYLILLQLATFNTFF